MKEEIETVICRATSEINRSVAYAQKEIERAQAQAQETVKLLQKLADVTEGGILESATVLAVGEACLSQVDVDPLTNSGLQLGWSQGPRIPVIRNANVKDGLRTTGRGRYRIIISMERIGPIAPEEPTSEIR